MSPQANLATIQAQLDRAVWTSCLEQRPYVAPSADESIRKAQDQIDNACWISVR